MQPTPLVEIIGPPYVGGSYNSHLLQASAGAPQEGVWVPVEFCKSGSIEVVGTFGALAAQLIGSNSLSDPSNVYTLTVGGTVTTNDVSTVTFTNPNLPNNGTRAVAYTSVGGDTTTTIATALTGAINSDSQLNALGINATSSGAVITITYPSGAPPRTAEGTSPQSPPMQNATVVSGASNGSATETFTVANASTGANVGPALSALGLAAIAVNTRWLKAVVTTLSGGNPTSPVLLRFHGSP